MLCLFLDERELSYEDPMPKSHWKAVKKKLWLHLLCDTLRLFGVETGIAVETCFLKKKYSKNKNLIQI